MLQGRAKAMILWGNGTDSERGVGSLRLWGNSNKVIRCRLGKETKPIELEAEVSI